MKAGEKCAHKTLRGRERRRFKGDFGGGRQVALAEKDFGQVGQDLAKCDRRSGLHENLGAQLCQFISTPQMLLPLRGPPMKDIPNF